MKAEKYRQVCGVKIDFDKFLETYDTSRLIESNVFCG